MSSPSNGRDIEEGLEVESLPRTPSVLLTIPFAQTAIATAADDAASEPFLATRIPPASSSAGPGLAGARVGSVVGSAADSEHNATVAVLSAGPDLLGNIDEPPPPSIGDAPPAMEGSSYDRQEPAPTVASATASASGLEEMDDDDAGPTPPVTMTDAAMIEKDGIVKQKARVTLVNETDVGPDPPASMLAEPSYDSDAPQRTAASKNMGQATRLQQIDDSAPAPFNSSEFEEEGGGKLRQQMEGGMETTTNRAEDQASRHVATDIINSNNAAGLTNETDHDNFIGDVDDAEVADDQNANIASDIERDPPIYVPEAWPVTGGDEENAEVVEVSEDAEIVLGTLALPWRKQKRTKLLILFVFAVIVSAAVAVGVSLSSGEAPASSEVAMVIVGSDAPSTSTGPSSIPSPHPTVAASGFPSDVPTVAPSSSFVPSSPPSACAQMISSQALTVDLQLERPRDTKMAVDGIKMVIVTKDSYTRKVKVRLNKVDSLELAEVKVFDRDGNNRAATRLASASHSSQFYGLVSPPNTAEQTDFSASKAIDGSIHTISHTSGRENGGEWFEVDLGELVYVDSVEIWSRQDCCQDRLTHATVSLINEYGKPWAMSDIDGTVRSVHRFDSSAFLTSSAANDTSVHVMFYSLTKNGWKRENVFRESNLGGEYGVALSRKTAIVGFTSFAEEASPSGAGAGVLIQYEQDESNGIWSKTKEPLFLNNRFGLSVDIDGELACVVAAAPSGATHIFRRASSKWVQIARLYLQPSDTCSVAGNDIAIHSPEGGVWFYQYDPILDTFSSPQQPIVTNVKTYALSKQFLVYLDRAESRVTIYNRDKHQESLFTHHQQLVSPHYGGNLALENDILVIGGDQTHILLEQNGYWKESITLNNPYDDYKLSGRNLLAMLENEVYSFSLLQCAQVSPTQMPSVSIAPTECYPIEISIVYDWNPWQTSFYLYRINFEGNGVKIRAHSAVAGDPSYRESMCLPKGQYEVIFHDTRGNGICCDSGEGHYAVTSSNGTLIAAGGDYRLKESTMFSLPFIPSVAPSIGPSMAPSSSAPSVLPTSSSSPTKACYFIEVNVFSDNYPGETYWNISTMHNEDGETKPKLVFDSSLVKLQVDGTLYSAFHIEKSADETSVNGVLCDCGVGMSQCECQGKVCLIERADNDFQGKVANCEGGGGLAAIIHNNGEEAISPSLGSNDANILAAFISHVDGKYLLDHGLEKNVVLSASSSWKFDANALNSRHLCLPEGDYKFAIYDAHGDGICCGEGEGYYSVTTSDGALIVQGGDFKDSEASQFSLPFVPAPSEMPSASLEPSSSTSPSTSPSLSQLPSVSSSPFASPSSSPTETCFWVEINVFTDYHPEENWLEISAIVNVDGTQEKILNVVWHSWDISTLNEGRVCLPEGDYELVIYDSTGNGVCCWWGGFFPKPAIEGHYNVTSNGVLIAKGGEFEYAEVTRFSLPVIPAPSQVPSASIAPSSSSPPSISKTLQPSMQPSITPPSITPSTSIPPTETCFFIEVKTFSDYEPSEYQWAVSSITTIDGVLEKKLVYDTSRRVVLHIDDELYSAIHIENSATDTSVDGLLCDCGSGTTQCECEGEVCLIERGSNYWNEKIANCQRGGGLAAIIYNNDREVPKILSIWEGHAVNIPAAFIVQADGKYLVKYGVGEAVTMAVSSPLKSEVISLGGSYVYRKLFSSHRSCLPEGKYEFKIDGRLLDRCVKPEEGHYNVSTPNYLITQGGVVKGEEITEFSLPFVPVRSQQPSSSPSQTPSSSLSPTMTLVPSMAPSTTLPSTTPSLSSSPTEMCFFIAVNMFSDFSTLETHWKLTTVLAVNGTEQKSLVYDSNRQVLLRIDGKLYSAIHIENSAIDTSVNGLLCDCGSGTTQCECQGKVCLIERGSNYFYEKVANCQRGGGLAAIIFNNVEGAIRRIKMSHLDRSARIPATFINKADGQYLAAFGLGEYVTMTTWSPFQFYVGTVNTRRFCLPEGEYELKISNHPGDFCNAPARGEGHFNVTTFDGELIALGGASWGEYTAGFTLPFVKSQ